LSRQKGDGGQIWRWLADSVSWLGAFLLGAPGGALVAYSFSNPDHLGKLQGFYVQYDIWGIPALTQSQANILTLFIGLVCGGAGLLLKAVADDKVEQERKRADEERARRESSGE
jgi:hypothetical protein